MRTAIAPLRVALVTAVLVAPLALGAALAQPSEEDDRLNFWVPPATGNAEKVKDLFDVVLWIAIVVFVFVEGLLVYVIWRFRKNRSVPKGETHRGHTGLEIVWTIVPALILIVIGVLSVQAMESTDVVPADTTVTVRVVAEQFSWSFEYPEGVEATVNKLYVEEGQRVRLDITAKDVIHAVWIPAFALKLDAVPGRVNTQWFDAPAAGEYFLQCAEYCGVGHHAMRASVIVFPKGTQEMPYGAPPTVDPGASVPPGPEAKIALLESAGPQTKPWSVDPFELQIAVKEGEGVHILADNPAANKGVHNFTVAGKVFNGDAYAPGRARFLNFTLADVGGPGTYEYWCAVPGHKDIGMRGRIVLTAA